MKFVKNPVSPLARESSVPAHMLQNGANTDGGRGSSWLTSCTWMDREFSLDGALSACGSPDCSMADSRLAAAISRTPLLGCAILLLAAAPSFAQSSAGRLGERSQSTIRISVSIAPRFAVTERAADAANVAGHGLEVATNAKALRYTIEPIDQVSAGPPREWHDQAPRSGTSPPARPPSLLLLIVPD